MARRSSKKKPSEPAAARTVSPDASKSADGAAESSVGAEETAEPEGPVGTKEPVQGQFLTFVVGGQEHALGVLRVREILEFHWATPVPSTPPWVKGVMNLRGSVLPVIDLAVKFGLPATRTTKRTGVVIVEPRIDGDVVVMGILVDSVSRVVELSRDDVEEPPAFGTVSRLEHLVGMGKVDDEFVPILDIDRILGEQALPAELREPGGSTGLAATAAVVERREPPAEGPGRE